MQVNPHSVEAMRVWASCYPERQQLWAYKQLLKKFPNAAFAHKQVAAYYFEQDNIEFAFEHIQKACQLDSRISKKNSLLAKCYAKLGKWEQSVAAYQGLSWIKEDPFTGTTNPTDMELAQDKIYEQRKGYSFIFPKLLIPILPINTETKE